MSQGKTRGRAGGAPAAPTTPGAWWQWLLIYPGLVLGLIGSLPTLIQAVESWRFDVPFAAVPVARASHAMFEKNVECLSEIGEPDHVVRLPDNTLIHAVACKTGDIMIRIDRPDGRSLIRWLESKSLMTAEADGLTPIARAAAQDREPASGRTPAVAVLCTFRLPDGKIARRIRLKSGSCSDEIINPYTGAVVAVRPAACAC